MSEKECLYQVRLRIFKEADKKQETITSLCKRYGISRKWFYKWKKRRDKEGDNSLRSKIRKAPKMPHKVPKEIEKQILNFVKEYPVYGPERIEAELKSTGIFVGPSGIYNVLKRKGLNTAKNRLEGVRKLSGEIVTRDEMARDKEKSKTNHIQASYPGQLVSQDTFYLGCIKGIGRIYPQVACDCFSSLWSG